MDGVKTLPVDIEVTHGRILGIAIPMTLAYLTTPLVGIVDMVVIGQLGDAALLGGIAVGAIIFNIVFTTFNFLRSGTTGLTAQALGAGDRQEINDIAWRALGLGIAAGLCIALLQVPIFLAAMYFMGASEQVREATGTYFYVRVLAAPVSLANYAVLGWLLGLGRAGIGLAIQTILNGTNMVLCIWFVLYLDWGIEGAAWSTVIAEAVGLVVGLTLVAVIHGQSLRLRLALVTAPDKVIRMLALNRDIMVRSFALIFAFTMFTAIGARSGDVVLAANAVLMNFFFFSGFFLDGFATAAEQLAGVAVGAGQRPAFERTVKLTILWGFGLAGLLTAAYFIFGANLIDLVTTSEDVRSVARDYLIWAIVTPVAGVLAFQMDGIFIGATWSRDMRNMMLASLAAYIISWWLLTPILGNHGLWLALVIFLGVRGITLLAITKRRADETFGTAIKSGL